MFIVMLQLWGVVPNLARILLFCVGIDEKTSNAKLADDDVSCEMNKQEMGGRKKTSDLERIDVKNDR